MIKKDGYNIISLFNGMNTGRCALDNVGVKVNKYYSSEIKPYAIKLTQYHHPDTIQVGDVRNWREWAIDWASIDLILSGSPCQDLSNAGKRAGIYGEKSGLFWVFVEILNHVKKYNPNVLFFQENVGSAPITDVGIMSRAMGVYPVRFDSNILTAQNRDRWYWTNAKTKPYGMFDDIITDIPYPKNKNILLKDIIESGTVTKDKANAILESQSRHVVNQESMIKRAAKDFITIVFDGGKYRKLSQTELERLQGFPDGWTSILEYNEAASLLGDGWTLPIIEHIFNYLPFEKVNNKSKPLAKAV